MNVRARAVEGTTTALIDSVLWGQVTNGLVVVDTGVIVAANPSAEALFGWNNHELEGQTIEALVPTGMQGRHGRWREEFRRIRSERTMTPDRTFLARRADDSVFPASIGLVPLDPDGLVLAVIHAAWLGGAPTQLTAGDSESLIQHLYAAGLGLRSHHQRLLEVPTDAPGANSVEAAIEVLEQVLLQMTSAPSVPSSPSVLRET